MNLVISDELLKNADMPEDEIRLELAIFLFQKGIFTLGKASEFAEIHRFEMQKVLAKRKIPMSYDEEEFEKDIIAIKKAKEQL